MSTTADGAATEETSLAGKELARATTAPLDAQKNVADTAETINSAIRWYRANEAMIIASLPLNTPGVTFRKNWPTQVLAKYIQSWEADSLGLKLAIAYVLNPLRTIKKEITQQNS